MSQLGILYQLDTPLGGGQAPTSLRFNEGIAGFVLNPNFEVDTSSWNALGTGVIIARTTSEHYLGTAALAVTIPAALANGGVALSLPYARASAGDAVVVKARVKGAPGQSARTRFSAFDVAGTQIGPTVLGSAVALDGTWLEASVAGIVPSGAVASVRVAVVLSTTPGAPYTFYVDEIRPLREPYLRLTEIDGLDFPTLRTGAQPRSQADGDIVFDSFRSGRYLTLNGQIAGGDRTQLDNEENALRQYLNSIVRADGTLRWSRRDGTARRMTVRLWEALRVTPGIVPAFQVQLVAADPYAYNDYQTVQSDATPLTASTYVNAGDADAYPVVRLMNGATAALTDVTITNQTTGRSMRWTGSVATGGGLDFDMANRTIKRVSDGLNKIAGLVAGTSSFWPLVPGANDVLVSAITGGPAASLQLTYRDAFIGG